MFGFLVLDKPARITSRTALDKIAWALRPHKVGHAGTLDPLATGVLVACVGPATRLVSYVQQMPKIYRAQFRLGFQSETEDVDSELLPCPTTLEISREQLVEVLPRFVGKIWQRPPAYSALRIRGQRAYQVARSGRQVDLAPREIEIHQLTLLAFHDSHFDLEIKCGSGTYVRSLGRDLAEALGTGAVMTKLQRTSIGCFSVDDALKLTEALPVEQAGLAARMISPVDGLQQGLGLRSICLSADNISDLQYGRRIRMDLKKIPMLESDLKKLFLGVDDQQRLLAILSVDSKASPIVSVAINFSGYWRKQTSG
jgi:tRNA pseudouridine55 synthase